MNKKILLIWYNQNHNNFYFRFLYTGTDLFIYDYYLGKKNAYNHELISMLLFDKDKTIPIKNYDEFGKYYNSKNLKYKSNFKNDLIDKIITLLNQLKKE